MTTTKKSNGSSQVQAKIPTQNGAMWDGPGANFPRKQMVRERWLSLNGEWDFSFDNALAWCRPDEVAEWQRKIKVPFCPEARASGIGDTGFHPRCWYQKKVSFEFDPGKKYLLHFGAVDYEAQVWINGHYLGCHTGGHTPFYFDITKMLVSEGEQTIVLRADDDPQDLAKPRGKQDWQLEAHQIWYPRTSGIWQTVWIEEVPPVYIDRLRWTSLLERWEIGCEAFINGTCTDDLRLRIRLSARDRLLADDIYQVISNEVHRRIALSDPGIDDFRNELLWSPEKPTLIDAEVELIQNGRVVDRLQSYTALRSVKVQRGRFLLNSRPYYLRMVLNQGYWPEGIMTAPSSEHLRKDIELIKTAGFNGVRMHQKIEDPEFLYWADKMGVIVWGEMPSAYRFTHESVERIMHEWAEVIDRDSNHPSICVWVPFNESWGVPDLTEKEAHRSCVQAMYHLTRTLDPTRPVIGNDGWESTATDILGIHDYDDQPERLVYKYRSDGNPNDVLTRRWPGGRMITVEGYPHEGQPIMLTEFGGIACINPAERDPQIWGYSVCLSGDDLQRRYEKLLGAVHRIEIFSGFCYTQFTDTYQEANGLFTIDRKPKFSLTAMARATRHNDYTRGELTSIPTPPPLPVVENQVLEPRGML